jgi:hypothetical protein
LADISSKKMRDIHNYFEGYENSKGLAFIQDFTALWAIKNKQMVNVWTFDYESDSSQLEWGMFSHDSDSESHLVTLSHIDVYPFFLWYESLEG